MNIACLHCQTPTPVSAQAGVDRCRSCGAVLVWPQFEPEQIDEAQLLKQAGRAASRYFVMPWTRSSLLGKPKRSGVVVSRACWMIDATLATQRSPTCTGCRGSKEVTCPDCAASGRARCSDCDGEGQVPGKRGLKQCTACRGKGDRKCKTCTKGTVVCPDCRGSGTAPAQVEHHTERQSRVLVDASFDARVLHPPLFDPGDFESAAARRTTLSGVELLSDTLWQLPDPSWTWPKELAPALAQTERAVQVRVQQFRARAAEIQLRTRWHACTLHFAGRPLLLAPPNLNPVRRRAQLAGGAAIFVALFGLGLTLYYAARSPWFGEHGHTPELALVAVLSGALAGLVMLAVSLSQRRRWQWATPLAGLAATALVGVGLWVSAQPDLGVAEQALARDDLDRAQFELDALVAIDDRSDEEAALRAQIIGRRGVLADDDRLRTIDAAASLDLAASTLRQQWHDPRRHSLALDEHLIQVRALIERAWDSADPQAMHMAVTATGGLDVELAAEARALEQLLNAREALANANLSRALEYFFSAQALDVVAVRRDTVATPLCAALETAARTQHALGFDEHNDLSERIAAFEAYHKFERDRIEIPCPDIGGLDPEKAEKQRVALTEKLAEKQAREQKAEQRRAAKEQRSNERSTSGGGGGGGSRSSGSRSSGCCKTCSNSQPCGDSCISWSKTCHKGAGCAC